VKNKEEEPKEYFERNVLFVIIIVVSGLFLDWLSLYLLIDVNPWGTATAIPGLILTLQGIWLIVNPYAIVFNNRFEIKQSYLYNKEFYYLDAKSIVATKSNSIGLVYNDDDVESVTLRGMRSSHKARFKTEITNRITESIKNRDF